MLEYSAWSIRVINGASFAGLSKQGMVIQAVSQTSGHDLHRLRPGREDEKYSDRRLGKKKNKLKGWWHGGRKSIDGEAKTEVGDVEASGRESFIADTASLLRRMDRQT